MKAIRLSMRINSSVVLAGLMVGLGAVESQAQLQPAAAKPTTAVLPGQPGLAPKIVPNANLKAFVATDPKVKISSAPAVSILEHAETLGLTAVNKVLDVVAPYHANALDGKLGDETVFGKDDRVLVTNTTSYPYAPICSLLMTFPNGKQFIGTGTFISYQTVLTAGHCVYDAAQGGWARSILVMPGRNGNSLPFGSAYGATFYSTTAWTSTNGDNGNHAYDFGAIRMPSTALGNKVGYFGYANEGDSYLTGNTMYTAGYPGDKGGTTMWKNNGWFSSVNSTNEYFQIDIMPGDSGSAIWTLINNGPYAVGIVTADNSSTNIGTRMNSNLFNFLQSVR